MKPVLINNANIVNEGAIFTGSVIVEGSLITKIIRGRQEFSGEKYHIIHADGKYLLPGVIDDQVHFREPGLTHKGDLYTESKAAVAGGITSFMEMPNTLPQTTTITELEKKFALAAQKSFANFSFYFGATNDNIEEIKKIDPAKVCGLKVFMGASTGNMLVDNLGSLEQIFKYSPVLIATHCEDESTILKNLAFYKDKFGDEIPIACHPGIRSREACLKSSSLAVSLAKKHGARLHVLHLSTADELKLFENKSLETDKKITCEVCVHHLWFSNEDYDKKGNFIKWNPAIKDHNDKEKLMDALNSDTIDVVASDHAPHTYEEKQQPYIKAPSGGPLVQHSLVAMLELNHQKKISIENIAKKMCHNPALLFHIEKRGFIRQGYFADLVLVDPNAPWTVAKDNILNKCGWSPFEGTTFKSKVTHTFVNGNLVYENGAINEFYGKALQFNR